MAINRTFTGKKQTVDKLGKPAKNAYNYRFTDLERSFNSYLEGVRVGRTEKHHRIVLKFLEPYLAKLSKKQALEVMKLVAQKTGFAYGDAKGNLVNLSRELHTKDINAVHNLLQRYTSLQGVKQRDEFLQESLRKTKWRGENVEVGNLVLHDTKGNYGIDPRTRIVGGQSDASLEFVDYFSKQKDVNHQADLLIGLLEETRPQFDGAIAAAVYLSDNPNITLEHKKRVLRQLGPESQTWMEDFINVIDEDSTRVVGELQQSIANLPANKQPTQAVLSQLEQNEKLQGLVQGYRNRLVDEPLPYQTARALNGNSSHIEDLRRVESGLPPLRRMVEPLDEVSSIPSDTPLVKPKSVGAAGFGAELAPSTKGLGGKVKDVLYDTNPQNYQNIADFTKAGTTVGRRVAAIMPFVGAAGDVWDVTERYKTMMEDPNTGFADWLDKAQFGIASATVGTTWWAEPVNTALGLTNLGIDIGRTIVEEDKRKAAGNMMRALGTAGMHEIRNFAKGFL